MDQPNLTPKTGLMSPQKAVLQKELLAISHLTDHSQFGNKVSFEVNIVITLFCDFAESVSPEMQ